MTVNGQSKSPSTFGTGQTVDKPHEMSGEKFSFKVPRNSLITQRTSRRSGILKVDFFLHFHNLPMKTLRRKMAKKSLNMLIKWVKMAQKV